jgi:hypothetical protein
VVYTVIDAHGNGVANVTDLLTALTTFSPDG